jgi:hypothetical protein
MEMDVMRRNKDSGVGVLVQFGKALGGERSSAALKTFHSHYLQLHTFEEDVGVLEMQTEKAMRVKNMYNLP